MVNHHEGERNDGFGDTPVGSRLICHHATGFRRRVRWGKERGSKVGRRELWISSVWVCVIGGDGILGELLIVGCWKMHGGAPMYFSHQNSRCHLRMLYLNYCCSFDLFHWQISTLFGFFMHDSPASLQHTVFFFPQRDYSTAELKCVTDGTKTRWRSTNNWLLPVAVMVPS